MGEKMHRFIWQRCHILPYLVGQGLEMMHDIAHPHPGNTLSDHPAQTNSNCFRD